MNPPPTDRTNTIRRRVVRGVIAGLTLLLIALLAIWYSLQPHPNLNALAIGPRAAAGVESPLEISLQAPAELDGMTRAAVFELRQAAVQRQASLLAGSYQPSQAVFGQIVDGRPWWGMTGQFFYGSGQDSPAGPSEESRFILNPYLLVAAEFYGLSIWGEDNFWNTGVTNQAALSRPDFPFQCPPQALRWWPSQARAEVTYDVTGCLEQLAPWTSRPHTLADAAAAITTYNARDLNLNYLQLVQAQSTNIRLATPFTAPIAIPEFIHLGTSCGVPGGCNNGSPYVDQFANITLAALPAQLSVALWKDQPAPSQPPDMTFVIHFK